MTTPDEIEAEKQNQLAKIRDANEAKALLYHPMLNASLDAIEAHYMKVLLNSREDQSSVREESYRMLKTSAMFKANLTSVITTGKFSESQQQKSDYSRKVVEDAGA